MENHSRIKGEQPFWGGKQRVDVKFLDPALLGDQVTEADQEVLKRDEIDGWASPHALESREDTGLFHHSPRQHGGEGRQCDSPVLVHFHELPTEPKSSTGPNCGSRLLPRMSS